MNRSTSPVVTEVGAAPTTVKNTFKSNDCANTVFSLARATTKRRYSSSNGSPSRGAPLSGQTKQGMNSIAGPPGRPSSVCLRPTPDVSDHPHIKPFFAAELDRARRY